MPLPLVVPISLWPDELRHIGVMCRRMSVCMGTWPDSRRNPESPAPRCSRNAKRWPM